MGQHLPVQNQGMGAGQLAQPLRMEALHAGHFGLEHPEEGGGRHYATSCSRWHAIAA